MKTQQQQLQEAGFWRLISEMLKEQSEQLKECHKTLNNLSAIVREKAAYDAKQSIDYAKDTNKHN